MRYEIRFGVALKKVCIASRRTLARGTNTASEPNLAVHMPDVGHPGDGVK